VVLLLTESKQSFRSPTDMLTTGSPNLGVARKCRPQETSARRSFVVTQASNTTVDIALVYARPSETLVRKLRLLLSERYSVWWTFIRATTGVKLKSSFLRRGS
jgi:hypothetical protein